MAILFTFHILSDGLHVAGSHEQIILGRGGVGLQVLVRVRLYVMSEDREAAFLLVSQHTLLWLGINSRTYLIQVTSHERSRKSGKHADTQVLKAWNWPTLPLHKVARKSAAQIQSLHVSIKFNFCVFVNWFTCLLLVICTFLLESCCTLSFKWSHKYCCDYMTRFFIIYVVTVSLHCHAHHRCLVLLFFISISWWHI